MATPTLKDLAAATGVSISTVSRALANHPAISQATTKKVKDAAEKLGYRPNAQARALRGSRSDAIGVVIPNLADPYFARIAAAIEAEAEREGIAAIMTTCSESPERLAKALDALTWRQVDGIITVPVEGAEAALNEAAKSRPLLLIDRELAPFPAVASDPRPGMFAALTQLRQKGHERIGYIPGPQQTSTGRQRLKVFRGATSEFSTFYAQGGYRRKDGYVGALELFEKDVTAIVAGDSMMTAGALEACYNAGKRIGTDIALVGFDDLNFFRLQPVPISVVDQDMAALGRLAVQQLTAAIAHNATPTGVKVPTTYIPRVSTAARLAES
ncbi:TPA: LacI family DNA-binding transcriptional regulator [Corynebacterium striatum]|nr:LacI family DNA-binding transcriptional regulator [Corynebacterium striatum]HCD3160934.1 LacI family DNA-binding transcriptional regulator [Corynebacterium striatum]HCD3683219.1 LacI family DNA-binding transcriptional regulator [Corynebacterium striatum]HCD4755623.1 LacI family DNA-binding transcriptional regulator [Corynebacterium striatum]HCD5913715.1 LacI family DNA-binding transcriptional regulator [Corynebacterium striatum]